MEPLACSIHAVELGDIQFSDTVVISGCGPLGLGMVTAAKLKNPKLLIALDLFDWKARGLCREGWGVGNSLVGRERMTGSGPEMVDGARGSG